MLTSILRGALLALAAMAWEEESPDTVTLLQRFHDTMADKNSMDMEAMKARMAEMEAQMATMKDQMAQMTQMTQMAMGTDGSSQDESDPRTPVIIDTDVDTDDQMAIAYLLAQPDFRVLAITVGCNGWSQQWAGVMSIMRLTKYFGQPDIPVAFSFRYNPDTQLNLNEPNGLPDPTLLTGKGNFLSEFVGLPFNIRPPSWMYTGRLLTETLWKSARKVDIIALGPLTNLAHFPAGFSQTFLFEGESDLQLRRHCGFAIQHPQLTKSGLTPLQTPLSPETLQIQNGTSSVIQLQPIRSCPLGFP